FHAPFFADRREWKAARAISLGNGGTARGELTYKKLKSSDHQTLVQVSGVLSSATFQDDKGVTAKDVRLVFNGEQTYNANLNVWTKGSATVEMSMQLTFGDTVGDSKGTIKLTMERLDSKK